MSSTAAVKQQFFVYAPDKKDEGAFARRLAVRQDHLDKAKVLHSEGFVKRAGALLTPESITGSEKKMVGSTFIIEAESLEDVRKMLEQDVYYVGDVWDPEALVILPYAAAPFTN